MPKSRRKCVKSLLPVLHIYCEGEKTEPNYLNGYLKKFHPGNRKLKIIKIENTNKNTPKQLVEEAINKKKDRETPESDVFWVVYDRESPTKYKNDLHKQALEKAKAKSINVALTNVCFEVWLLLHLIDVRASYSCYNDLIKNSQLKIKLNDKGINKYEKGYTSIFEKISDGVNIARSRAKKMNKDTIQTSLHNADKPYLLNPYTDMHLLLDAIDNFTEENK